LLEDRATYLVPVFMHEIAGKQVQAVDLRELHANLENGDNFSTWIKERIKKYGFSEGHDYVAISVIPENGGRRTDYYGTLSMGKELAMVEDNAKGRMIRRYFITVDEQLRAGGGGMSVSGAQGLLGFRAFVLIASKASGTVCSPTRALTRSRTALRSCFSTAGAMNFFTTNAFR
jgi:phage anti-repressor protein